MTSPPSIAPVSPTRRRIVGLLAALAFFVVPFVAGYQVGHDGGSNASSSATAFMPGTANPTLPSQGNGSSSGGFTIPGSGSSGSSGGTNTSRNTGRIDAASVADKVDDSVVNLLVSYRSGGEAAGTGIVISPAGLVVTNNHVITNAEGIQVEFATTGTTKSAKVLGYSLVGDVALLQIQGVSNVKAAPLGTSSTLAIGDPVVALGNAGGHGGDPTVVSGNVTDLDQQITASDSDGSNVQTLQNLIEVDANIQAGDSGGPLVDGSGSVVGMNAAASVGNGGFRFNGQGNNQGYAIPIEDVVSIAKKITAGTSTADVHVGSERAVLGVQVQADTAVGRRSPFGSRQTGNGATVLDVDNSSGAAKAGISGGDTITAIDGRTVTSGSDLTRAMVRYSPGDSVQVAWVDSSGDNHHATVKLGSGTPA